MSYVLHEPYARRHAAASVVVEVRGTEHDADELAEQVRLLVREGAAAEDGERRGSMRVAEGRESLRLWSSRSCHIWNAQYGQCVFVVSEVTVRNRGGRDTDSARDHRAQDVLQQPIADFAK
jgi:hypothetical protein